MNIQSDIQVYQIILNIVIICILDQALVECTQDETDSNVLEITVSEQDSSLSYDASTVMGSETACIEVTIKCPPSITEFWGGSVCPGDLIFEDNFDTMDWTKWQREIRIPVDKDECEFVSYQNRDENCYINNGKLRITPSLQSEVSGYGVTGIRTGTLDLTKDCTGWTPEECKRTGHSFQILPPIISTRIRTKGSFEFHYGRVEIRARLPRADWAIPLILLEPADDYYGKGKKSGQLKMIILGNNETENYYNFFQNPTPMDLIDDYHVYTLEWTDEYIALKKDDKEYSRIYGGLKEKAIGTEYSRNWHKGGHMAPFDRRFFITLGVAIGGHLDFPDGSTSRSKKKKTWTNFDPKSTVKFWKARSQWESSYRLGNTGLSVDYIRVFAL